ncbi:hypothetical protein DKX38_000392 [Salix brachista]|uniref:Uncharacterized protein n=1 Tax=Salix brachista TaxID=2182728 RepID=A0A5N5P261_9ROSI|nr:hypothetical protein DKX38_000392 [Salix brachista]
MGFIMEFAENLVLRLMEDPKERDRKFRERVYAVKDRCQKTKEMWSYPLRPYGFWTFERHNAQLAWDAKISQVPGRRDPYDDLLQDSYGSPNQRFSHFSYASSLLLDILAIFVWWGWHGQGDLSEFGTQKICRKFYMQSSHEALRTRLYAMPLHDLKESFESRPMSYVMRMKAMLTRNPEEHT